MHHHFVPTYAAAVAASAAEGVPFVAASFRAAAAAVALHVTPGETPEVLVVRAAAGDAAVL